MVDTVLKELVDKTVVHVDWSEGDNYVKLTTKTGNLYEHYLIISEDKLLKVEKVGPPFIIGVTRDIGDVQVKVPGDLNITIREGV